MKFTLLILPVLMKALGVAAYGPPSFNDPSFPCPFRDLTCQCSPPFRSSAAACQSITCTPRNYRKAQKLTNCLCAPLYDNNTISSTVVSAAIATATSAAASALKTADPANPDTYPPCARACITPALQTDCGTFNETKCVCQSPVFFANITPCEVGTCPLADLQTTLYLSEANCNKAGIGGLGNRETQVAAFDETLGGAAGGDLEGFFDQLMEGGNDVSANDGSGNDGSTKMMRRTDGPTAGTARPKKVGRSFFGMCGLWWFWCNE
ncbi:MAG: hypothetical protein L6R37_008035 [Teloschistes peruensis]|nr:MAG: hypothetical protein L6R37_008035 [Teloschistes peruensis]